MGHGLRRCEELRGEISDRGVLDHQTQGESGRRFYGWVHHEEVCVASR